MAFVNYCLVNVTYAETYISDSQVLLHDPKIEDKFVLIGSQSTGKKKPF